MIAEHLSTWAEEWILWSTVEFGFLKLPQAFCTGSSLMPQKVNPDVLELIRGKTARVIGNLQALLVLVKGLPLAYNRDLQEDKPPLLDSFDTVRASLELAAPLVAGAELNRPAIAERLDRGHMDATALMEHLIGRGIPQRTAHELVGRLVRKALDRGVRLADLPIEDFRQADAALDEGVYGVLGPQHAVAAMTSYGSTGPEQVRQQIARWKALLSRTGSDDMRNTMKRPSERAAGFIPAVGLPCCPACCCCHRPCRPAPRRRRRRPRRPRRSPLPWPSNPRRRTTRPNRPRCPWQRRTRR